MAARWIYAAETSGYGAAYCRECQRAAQIRKQENVCDDCTGRMPDLGRIRKYLDCFVLCDSQFRATGGNVYALDWPVIMTTARAMHMQIDKTFLRLLKAFERVFIKEANRGKQ